MIVTILDDDKVGHDMAESTAINIGVGKETVEWLQQNGYKDYISIEKAQEIDLSTGEYRIEIDSIVGIPEVGAKGLWEYIIFKIEELAPIDLRKAIDMPVNEVLYAREIADSLTYLNEYADSITSPTRDGLFCRAL